MLQIIQSVSKIREMLLEPKEQSPNASQIFGALLREYQDLYNSLGNTNLGWTKDDIYLTVGGANRDYQIGDASFGKALFVTTEDGIGGGISIPFCNLAEQATGDSFFYEGANLDFYNAYAFPNDAQIAFYRKEGQTYARTSGLYNTNFPRLRITYSVGNWTENVDPHSTAVLSEHHHLVETRAAITQLAGAEWSDDREANKEKRADLRASLIWQESRYRETFDVYKRTMNGDQISWREGFGDDW